ncbi:hypothetical protein BMF94_3930 [Rhodotorula taiwanensis]|uniref:Amino acid transporter transmembrane domain-containing protein n=1 Tax=Rhodotorula taiwanensis TaxID=741276 RepID=A0A2S5B8I7_9BASI|nr:hypothetical protein BMF94_3930 [Rhodotorula taiwanensis]
MATTAYNEKPLSEKDLENAPGQTTFITREDEPRAAVADAFALREGDEDQEDFKTLGWFKAGLVLTCEAIALGTLSFPQNFYRLGMAGGIIANCGFIVIAYVTTHWMVDFKLRYPHVLNVAEAGEVIFGKWGGRVLGVGMVAKSIGLASSHVLAGKIALSVFDDGKTCSIVFAVVVAVISAALSYSRKWSGLTWLSVLSLSCIFTASMITVIAVALQDNTRLIKKGVPIHWEAFPKENVTFYSVSGAILNTVFAYGQVMAVFSFLPEMKRPNDFKKSMLLSQAISLVIYTIVGAVCYRYAGQYVTSPALSMTTRKVEIVAYAFAFVTIIVSGIVAANVGAKYLYTSLFRHSPLLTSKSWKAQGAWLAIIAVVWSVGFVLAELIPFFSQLLTIISSLTSSWFVVGLGGIVYLHMVNPKLPEVVDGGYFKRPSRTFGTCVALSFVLISCFLTPAGLASSIKGIKDGYSGGKYDHPFSCKA